MLSAIAARKAAQAAKLTTASQSPLSSSRNGSEAEQETGSHSDHQIKSVLRPRKSKRKQNEPASSAARKKRRRKNPKSEIAHSRYYEARDNTAEVVEQGEYSSSSSSDSDEDMGEVRFAEADLGDIIRPQQSRKSQRAWSPSAPPPDSSDDQLDFSKAGPSGTPFRRTRDSGYQTPFSLSFSPQAGKNVFYIDGSEHGTLSGRKGTIVALEEGETMSLLGVYSLTVLRGTVSLMGTELRASGSRPHTVFAPKCCPIPIIEAVSTKGFPTYPLPETISPAISSETAVLFLEDTHTGVEGLGRVCKTFENVFDVSSLGDAALNLSSARIVSSMTRTMQAFQLPGSWRTALSSLPLSSSTEDEDVDVVQSLDPLMLLVRGQKRTGKSTFARTLLNRLVCWYHRVAYLECDIGQTEFTPPGLVSLHIVDRPIFGPPFTHPRLPYASHYIGASSPRDNPEHYLAAVSALLQTFRLELQYPAPEDEFYYRDSDAEDDRVSDVVPLVVNTMGWLKGLGADLARRIEEMVAPTHVFSTESLSTAPENAFPVERMMFTDHESDRRRDRPQIIEVEAFSPSSQSMRYSAADWRTVALMSYFHSTPSPAQYEFLPQQLQPSNLPPYDPHSPLCTWDCRLPLVSQVPYAVSPAEAVDNIVLVGAGMEDVVPSELARVLNGAIVALVSREPDFPEPSPRKNQWERLPYVQGFPPPDPSTSNCIGLALIRGVSPSLFDTPADSERADTENDLLHVLTPLPLELIAAAGARCLVKGEIELPVWGMLDYRELEHGDARTREIDVPYLQWSKSDAIGAERRRVRRNIMRKGQM